MSVRAGTRSIGPLMELTYQVVVARITAQTRVAGRINPTDSWSQLNQPIPCDVAPLRDDLRFAQSGSDVLATHVLHFYTGTDIREKDRVKVISNWRFAGPIGSWYEITSRLEPSDGMIGFVKCYAVLSDKPPGLIV